MDGEKETYNRVYESWLAGKINLAVGDEKNHIPGFRKPQRAAIYAVLSHLDVKCDEPAMIVMPTGTGKTEVIFSLMIAGLFQRTLVIVPSDALRTQFSDRLRSLEKLRQLDAVSENILSPVVHIVDSAESAMNENLIEQSNVAVATAASLAQLNDKNLANILARFTHLVFDEAHHVAASTWERIKKSFQPKPILCFTATPFREDQQRLEGKIIFNYSLAQAQRDGYFQRIEFHPIREYVEENVDRQIANKAVELLTRDIEFGLDHILIARCKTIKKAEGVLEVYEEFGKRFNPIILHSKAARKSEKLNQILDRKSRIIICVDMLGEGFDLPALKIAAIHDPHQSPAITLQFIGRFTRISKKLGSAKFVANVANQRTKEAINRLYQESADWSRIIQEVSSAKIGRELNRQQFEEKFEGDSDLSKIMALNPVPKISSVAYQINTTWFPERVEKLAGRDEELQLFSVSADQSIIIAVTKEVAQTLWAKSKTLDTVKWHLYLAYYRKKDSILFVSCTADDENHNNFRKLIAPDAKRVDGETAFRVMHGLDRLKLSNVGLIRGTSDVSFTMHVGKDVNKVIDDLENGRAIKSNIFGSGYSNGTPTTAGCSSKGKLWKMDTGTIDEWVAWCDLVASKLSNSAIDTSSILKNVLRHQRIKKVWPKGIFYADWPDSIGVNTEDRWSINVDSNSYPLLDVSLGRPFLESDDAVICVPVVSESKNAEVTRIRVRLIDDGYEYLSSNDQASISTGSKTRRLNEYFNSEQLRFLQVDGSIIIGNHRYYSEASLNIKLPMHLLFSWDWESVNINKESMSNETDFSTVQGFTFQQIFDSHEIIFNDDGSGEIADLIAIREETDFLQICLYHCKYCGLGHSPGARVDDLYTVAGQASRSAKWVHHGAQLFGRLLKRYSDSKGKGKNRLLKGNIVRVEELKSKSDLLEMRMQFFIVQPAISLNKVNDEVLSVLGTSYKYIKDIANVDLKVICSP